MTALSNQEMLDLEFAAAQTAEYHKGRQANQKGHGYPPHFINTISIEFRLGWVSAERLDILHELKENKS